MTRTLRPGEALPLSELSAFGTDRLTIGLTVEGPSPDLVALLLGKDHRVRTDDDLVFYNSPASGDGAVLWVGQPERPQTVTIVPDRLDIDVDRVVLGAAGGLLDVPAPALLTVTVANANGQSVGVATFQADAPLTAMLLVEVYRRAGAWRIRLLAQGYAGGLAALVTAFGVQVDDPGEASPPALEPSNGRTGAEPEGNYPAAQHPAEPAALPPMPPGPWSPAPPPHPPAGPGPAHQLPLADGSATGHVENQPSPSWSPEQGPQRRRGLFTSRKRGQLEAQNAELSRLLNATGALDNAAIDAERQRLIGEVGALVAEADRRRAELASLEHRLEQVRSAIAVAEGDMELTEIGIYNYRHRLDDAVAYKAQLDQIRDRIKSAAKTGNAVTGAANWTVNGSSAQGRKMVNEVSKLMLRAYNADADHAVRSLRPYKLDSALARLDTTRSTIARLGTTMSITVTDYYHKLRRAELELTSDYLNKVEEEKENQRALREQQREQARADAEYVREQVKLERDRDKYADALARLETLGAADPQQIAQIRSQLTSVNAALEQVAYRRSNMRLGYVYVIANLGAFGGRMVKIGMTRRVTPEDRVRELGDASVPFRFDTHALVFSEDAVALETALHKRFADRAVNQVNRHREFFYVTPGEVRQALVEMSLGEHIVVQYDEQTPADEWHRSGSPDRTILAT